MFCSSRKLWHGQGFRTSELRWPAFGKLRTLMVRNCSSRTIRPVTSSWSMFRDLQQWNFRVVSAMHRHTGSECRRVAATFIHPQPGDDRNLLLALLRARDNDAAHARCGRVRHVHVGDARQIGAVGIDGQARVAGSRRPTRCACARRWEWSGRCLRLVPAILRSVRLSSASCWALTSALLDTRISIG